MDTLISKKELLKLTQISYGQLYRWKRMHVIPEEWFIRKATPTGQETYFEREKILERIEFILSQKDNASLDEIASMVNQNDGKYLFPSAENIDDELIGTYAKGVFYSLYNKDQPIGGKELLVLHMIQTHLVKSQITMDELKVIIGVLDEQYDLLYANDGKLFLFRKMGVPFVVATLHSEILYPEQAAVGVLEISVAQVTDLLRKKVSGDE